MGMTHSETHRSWKVAAHHLVSSIICTYELPCFARWGDNLFFFFFKLILSFLPTEFYDCYFDQEPNVFEENKFLWVLSSPFPCSCKSLKLGGANTFITQRPYKPFRFFFTPFFTTNASLIQDIFGCNLTSKLYFHIPTCIPNCWAPFPCISSSFPVLSLPMILEATCLFGIANSIQKVHDYWRAT